MVIVYDAANGTVANLRKGTDKTVMFVEQSVKPFFFGLRDFWGRWSIDRAGVTSGNYSTKDIRLMVDRGEIGAHTWLRHVWTQRFALVGEALMANQLASAEEFEAWFPMRRERTPVATL